MPNVREATIAIKVVGNAFENINKIIGAFKQLAAMAKNPIVLRVAIDSESLKRSNKVIEDALQAKKPVEVPTEVAETEVTPPEFESQIVPVKPEVTENPVFPPLYLPVYYSGKIPLSGTPTQPIPPTGIVPLPEKRIAPLPEKSIIPLTDILNQSRQFAQGVDIKIKAASKLAGQTSLLRSIFNNLTGSLGSVIGQFRDVRGERGVSELMEDMKEKTDEASFSIDRVSGKIKTLGQALHDERFATTTIFTSLASMYLFTKLPEAAMNHDQMKREFIARAREKKWGEDIIEELVSSQPAVRGVSRYEHLEALSTVGWYEREADKLLPQITNMEKFYAAYKETLRTQAGIGSFGELMSAIHSGNYEVLRPVLGTNIITEIQAIPEAYREVMQEYIKEGMPADIAEQRVKELATIDAINKKLEQTADLEQRIGDNTRMTWQDFYSAVIDAGIAIGETVLPAMVGLANAARWFADLISQHKILATIIGWAIVLGLIATLLGLIVSIIMSAVGGIGIMASLLGMIGLGLPEIVALCVAFAAAFAIIPPILNAIGSKLGWIMSIFEGFDLGKLLSGDLSQLGKIGENLKNMLTARIKLVFTEGVFKGFDLGKFISGDLGQIRTILGNIKESLRGEYASVFGNTIANAIFSLPEAIINGIVSGIRYTFHDFFNPIISAINTLSGIGSVIYNTLSSIWSKLSNIFDNIKGFALGKVSPGTVVGTIKERVVGLLTGIPFKTMLTAQVAGGPTQKDLSDMKNNIKIVTTAIAGPVMGNVIDRFPFVITILNLTYEIILKIYEVIKRLLDWINEKLTWIHDKIASIWGWMGDFFGNLKNLLFDLLSKIPGLGWLGESEAEKELREKYGFTGWGESENKGMVGFTKYGIDIMGTPDEIKEAMRKEIPKYTGGASNNTLVGGQYTKFIEEHPEWAQYLEPYTTSYYTPYEATLPIESGGLGVPPDLLNEAEKNKPHEPINVPSPEEIIEGAKEGLEEETKESAEKTEENLKNKYTAFGAADWSVLSPFKYGYHALQGALGTFDVGSTFEKGGLFAGFVHSSEEIIPQAIAKRGAGPISSAIDTLQEIVTQNKRDLERIEKYDVGVSFGRTGIFKGIVHAPEEIIPKTIAQRGPGPISKVIGTLQNISTTQISSRKDSLINAVIQRSNFALDKMLSENTSREETYAMPTYNINLSVGIDNPVIDSRERIDELTTELRHKVERMIRDVIHREMRYYTRA